jgi:predicted secreted protein
VRAVVFSGVFFIGWFVSFLCLLPVGAGAGIDRDTGAPLNPRLGLKFLIATAVAFVVTAVFYGCIAVGWIDI